MQVTADVCHCRRFSFLFLSFAGFLRVRFIQEQRETLDSLTDAGEERPRSPCRHQGAQQPSHHGIVATVTRRRAIHIATAAAGPNWIPATLSLSSWMQTNCGVTREESTENKSGNIFAFLDGKKIPIPPSLPKCHTRVRAWKNGKEPFVPPPQKTCGASSPSRPLHQRVWKSNGPLGVASSRLLPSPPHFL